MSVNLVPCVDAERNSTEYCLIFLEIKQIKMAGLACSGSGALVLGSKMGHKTLGYAFMTVFSMVLLEGFLFDKTKDAVVECTDSAKRACKILDERVCNATVTV